MNAGVGEAGLVLDRFQRQAVGHLDGGRSVLVSAPTGSGKTLVAEHAIDRALSAGLRAFYTTPIKALSNQKYLDFRSRLGLGRVGLLTGDNAVDGDADVVVMTTEVLRNMLYTGDIGDRLGVVVLDEVHYLADAYRGSVWEEVILHLPEPVKLVCLSATVSNHGELGGWLDRVHGPLAVVSEDERPVPLTNLYAVGRRRGGGLHLLETFVDGEPNAAARRFDAPAGGMRRGDRPRRGRGRSRGLPRRSPRRGDLLGELATRDLMPVIWFIFSRKGCDNAAAQLVRRGECYTDESAATRIDGLVESGLSGLDRGDRSALGVRRWAEMLRRGVAAHHAGMVPVFKEVVERCFTAGLVKVVFATETLALGVNMPARSVVIEKLSKYDGSRNAPLNAAQYTQLTGRAGRRGIDEAGRAVVLWSPHTGFDDVAELAACRSFRLSSAFRPTYNMVACLLGRMSPDQARVLIAGSFAQYQADAALSSDAPNRSGAVPGTRGRTDRPRRDPSDAPTDLARQFDAVAAVLHERGHLDGWSPTPSGELLTRIYHEADLALTEALSSGLMDGLSPPELASVLSSFTYEHRAPGPPPKSWVPSAIAYRRLCAITRRMESLHRTERRHRVPLTRRLDTGFAAMAHHWAAGMRLREVLSYDPSAGRGPTGRSAGEFVRNVKQIVDLACRVARVAVGADTAAAARRAAEAMNRGVVVLSGVVADPPTSGRSE